MKQAMYRIKQVEKWWFVEKRNVWDRFSQVSRHCREDLAMKSMHRLERKAMREA